MKLPKKRKEKKERERKRKKRVKLGYFNGLLSYLVQQSLAQPQVGAKLNLREHKKRLLFYTIMSQYMNQNPPVSWHIS